MYISYRRCVFYTLRIIGYNLTITYKVIIVKTSAFIQLCHVSCKYILIKYSYFFANVQNSRRTCNVESCRFHRTMTYTCTRQKSSCNIRFVSAERKHTFRQMLFLCFKQEFDIIFCTSQKIRISCFLVIVCKL